MLNAGDVLLIYCSSINPPKSKYVLCVSPFPLFFFINSEPRRSKLDAQVLIKKDELSFLVKDSYINTGTVVTFSQYELQQSKHLGTLKDIIKGEVKKVVSNHGYLTEIHKEVVINNFE